MSTGELLSDWTLLHQMTRAAIFSEGSAHKKHWLAAVGVHFACDYVRDRNPLVKGGCAY